MLKFVRKLSQPIGGHPLWPYPLRVDSNFVRHSYIYIYIYIYDWLVVWNIFVFSIIYGIILPIDFHIFQRGRSTTKQLMLIDQKQMCQNNINIYIYGKCLGSARTRNIDGRRIIIIIIINQTLIGDLQCM